MSEEKDDWRPIMTIPTGEPNDFGDALGPIVHVWLPSEGHPWIARWAKRDEQPAGIFSTYSESMGSWTVQLDGHPDSAYHPTHWMPLPDPPKASE